MKPWMKFVAAAVVVLGVDSARASDFVVTYDVEDKPLKEAVSGTMLTFDLFEDSACTVYVAQQSIAIDDVKVSKLKLFAPSGGVKPPKTDTMQATMTGSDFSRASYLKVTGTGITAVGGDCQPQAANSSGKVVGVSSMSGISGSVPIGGSEFAFVGAKTSIRVAEGETLIASGHAALQGVGGSKTIKLGVCYVNAFLGGSLTNFAGFLGPWTVADAVTTHSAAGSVIPGAGFWDVGLCVQSAQGGFVGYDDGSGFAMVVH